MAIERYTERLAHNEIRNTAIDMHNALREIKVTESHKPIFIAGILIALNDKDFSKSYSSLTSYQLIMQNIQNAIENVLKNSDIKSNRIRYIKVDALGVFYHEFIKYSGGDGSGLGIVLTPQHLTEFMCDLAGVNKNSRVVDICCGSGSFLVTAMSKMFQNANPAETDGIRKNGLYGVEFDDGLYTLAIANMIIRKDGKSNIYKGDCFNQDITDELKSKNINIGLINPPYSQKDVTELEFVEHLLDILTVGGTGVVVVPMNCAIGTKFKDIRERLMKKHTLDAVFSMPDDIFYPTGTNVCVMVWTTHTPHDCMQETFFGYCKNDGFVKRKKLGRIDAFGKWESIEQEWLEWKEYKMDALFHIEKGKRLTKADMIDGPDNYLGAISHNNGVRQKISAGKLWRANCITVNYNGSVGEAFYQPKPFWASDDVNVLYAKDFWKMNKYIGMFLITVIKANKYRFGYGRKWTLEKMKETVLKLPSQEDGTPDFLYMENYIKSLPYSDRI